MKRLTARRLIGKDTLYIAGYGTRELIKAVGGNPQWSRTQHAWMTSVRRGSDAIAFAESKGYDVDYSEIEFGGAA